VLAKLGEYLAAVRFRQVQVQKQKIRQRSPARLSNVRYPSQCFRAIPDHVQLMQDVVLTERFLHQQNVPGVVFG
jgi:trans-aconitate methyltransferase